MVRSRPVAVPSPEHRPFLEALAELLADAVQRDLPRLRQETLWRPPADRRRNLDSVGLWLLQ